MLHFFLKNAFCFQIKYGNFALKGHGFFFLIMFLKTDSVGLEKYTTIILKYTFHKVHFIFSP